MSVRARARVCVCVCVIKHLAVSDTLITWYAAAAAAFCASTLPFCMACGSAVGTPAVTACSATSLVLDTTPARSLYTGGTNTYTLNLVHSYVRQCGIALL